VDTEFEFDEIELVERGESAPECGGGAVLTFGSVSNSKRDSPFAGGGGGTSSSAAVVDAVVAAAANMTAGFRPAIDARFAKSSLSLRPDNWLRI
jgi:hypothetical protein